MSRQLRTHGPGFGIQEYCKDLVVSGGDVSKQNGRAAAGLDRTSYCLNTIGGPLIRFPLRSTVTSTLSPMWTKGMPLFMP